jgi:hypothetical protein
MAIGAWNQSENTAITDAHCANPAQGKPNKRQVPYRANVTAHSGCHIHGTGLGSRIQVNEKLVTSVDLDLIEYNEAEVASTKDKENDPPRQHKSESQELLDAIERGNGERALTLLKQGVDPNTKDALGRTALMYAGINGQTKIIMPALLDKGADANAKSLDGTTALIAAVIFGDPDAVRLLLRHGANMNARDNNGDSALDWAVIRLRTAPSDRSLLNFRERNSNGDLTMATAKEVQEVIEVLKAAGAKE